MSFLRRLLLIRARIGLGLVVLGFFAKTFHQVGADFTSWLQPGPSSAVAASPQPHPSPAVPLPETPPIPAPVPVASTPAPPLPAESLPVWHAPATLPDLADGTLVTPDKIYSNARIIRVEADRVTIEYAGGQAFVPTWELPSDLRTQLNYDPKAAQLATTKRQQP